jgi:hypothetical protein
MPSTDSVSHTDLIVCACGDREYNIRDVADAALWRGHLGPIWDKFAIGLMAEKRADELELEFDDAEIDSAAEIFRYERDLITAEETERWLAVRGLTLDEFSDYFARQYCRNKLGEEVEVSDMTYTSVPNDLRQLFAAELILSGDLGQLSTPLMWRLAAAKAEKEATAENITEAERMFFDRHGINASELPNWLSALGRELVWHAEMLAMEAAYQQRCLTLLQPHSRKHELHSLRLPLTRFETEVLELESRDAAQEALFCVTEDGMSMEEVAAEGRYPYRRIDFLLEDLPPELQQEFMSVSPGEVLEPMPRGDGFELCRVATRTEPDADDPAIKLRVEQRLLDRHFSELSNKHVQRRLDAVVATE